MITNLKLENFKIIGSEAEFKFAPITILTGANHSGKSTIIEALQILNQGVLNKNHKLSRLKINDLADQVGDIVNMINFKDDSKEFSFSYPFHVTFRKKNKNLFITNLKTNWWLKISYKTNIENHEEAILSLLQIEDTDGKIAFELSHILDQHQDNPDYWIKINFDTLFSNNLIPTDHTFFEFDNFETDEELKNVTWQSIKKYFSDGYPVYEEYLDSIENVLFNREEITGLADLFHGLYDHLHDSADYIFNNVNRNGLISDQDPQPYPTQPLYQLINSIHFFLQEIFSFNQKEFKISHLGPLRGMSKRLFGNNENIEIVKTINRYTFLKHKASQKEKDFINKWSRIFIGGDKLEIYRVEGVATSIKIKEDDKYSSIADYGYGASQFLPILLEAVNCSIENQFDTIDKTLIIEEPEANLHPNLQSLLADFFMDLYKELQVRVIIETHSEYLIRKLQYLVAKKSAKNSDIIIHYFQKGKSPREMKILPDGIINQEFGEGFYDEATRLSIELLKLKSFQYN